MTEIQQPGIDAQELLSDIIHKEPETVEADGRKTRIGWLHKDTEMRMSRVMLKEKDVEKQRVKWYSLARLDRRSGFLTWVLGWLWYWAHWRWIWYVRRERGTQYQMAVIEAVKKKIQERSEALGLSTILMIEGMDTMMMMARHEAGPAARRGVPATP